MRSYSRIGAAAAFSLLVAPGSVFASRTLKVINKCSYNVWPAVSPFSNQEEAYADSKAWVMTSGSTKSVTLPSTFTGRIWGRRGCVSQTDGTLVCVTGACANNAAECQDGELGTGTALELRLQWSNNGQYDVIDLQNGGGFSSPVSVEPEADGCSKITCEPPLSTCPDDQLKLQDSYGVTLGCMSACYAGVGDSAVQCCSGDYNNADSCTPDLITYYDYFKTPCESSYAYFQDSRAGQETVDFLCASSGDPGFTFTFCPDGDGDSGSSSGASGSGGTGTATGTGVANPTNIPSTAATVAATDASASGASESSGASAASGMSGASDISASSGASASSSAGATATAGSSAVASSSKATTPTTSASTSSASSAADTTDTESTDEDSSGLSTTQLAAIGGGLVVVAILAIGLVVFCVKRKNNQQAQQQAPADSDVEQGRPATQAAAAQSGQGKNPAQNYNALGHHSRSRRSQSALLSESSDALSSSGEESEEPPRAPRRIRVTLLTFACSSSPPPIFPTDLTASSTLTARVSSSFCNHACLLRRSPTCRPMSTSPRLPLLSLQAGDLLGSTVIPANFEPKIPVQVEYESFGQVHIGSRYTTAETQGEPAVTFQATPGEESKYVILLADPDAPSKEDPKWGPFRHWTLADVVPGQSPGTTLTTYMGPAPPPKTGPHRYVFLVYKQPVDHTPELGVDGDERSKFDILGFAKKNELELVGVNFFSAQNEEQ
ncbi:hypothetical protein JCM8547_001270 [Rhodosporidiobolus lusitaniae]